MDFVQIDVTAERDRDSYGNPKPGKAVYVSLALLREEESIRQKIETMCGRDRYVYEGVCNMWLAGHEYFTLKELAQKMGFSKNLNGNQYEQVKESILRIMSTVIYVDNTEEAKAYGYPLTKKYANLAHADMIDTETAGKTAMDRYIDWKLNNKQHNAFKEKIVVVLYTTPILLEIAQDRNQITTIDVAVRQIPNFYRTDRASDIEEELLDRIELSSRRNRDVNINIYNFCDLLAIPAKKKKEAIATAAKILDHYKNIGFTKDYKVDGKSILIKTKHRAVKKYKSQKTSDARQ